MGEIEIKKVEMADESDVVYKIYIDGLNAGIILPEGDLFICYLKFMDDWDESKKYESIDEIINVLKQKIKP